MLPPLKAIKTAKLSMQRTTFEQGEIRISVPTTRALWLDESISASASSFMPPPGSREFAHLHKDASFHLVMADEDKQKVIRKGWGVHLLGAAISFAVGFLPDFAFARWLRPARRRVRALGSASINGRVGTLGITSLLQLFRLAAFALVTSGVYLAFFDADPTDHITFFFYVSVLAIFRLATIGSAFWHAPTEPALRLPTLDDQSARRLHHTLLTAVALGAFGF